MSMLALVAGRGVRGALAELQHRPRRPATESFYFLCYYLIVFLCWVLYHAFIWFILERCRCCLLANYGGMQADESALDVLGATSA